METEQKEVMCKYKKIICKIFGEQIRVIGESSAIGPMGQFQIRQKFMLHWMQTAGHLRLI